jgi:hypothetical protein
MESMEQGRYIIYTDYAAALAEAEKLVERYETELNLSVRLETYNAVDAQLAASQAECARLREAIQNSLDAFKRAKAGDPEMDWDQAIQTVEDELEAALSTATASTGKGE